MTINTGINASRRRPQTFHRFTYLLGGRLLQPLAQAIAIIGTMTATGTATAGQVYDVDDIEQGDLLFGRQSEVALQIRTALKTQTKLGAGPRIKAIGVVEPGGGVAAIRTLTLTGNATESNNFVLDVAGRRYYVGVTQGDTPTIMATAITNVLKGAIEELPVVPTSAAGVVSLTHPFKGINGQAVSITVLAKPAGVTAVVANPTPGTGVISIVTALDAIAAIEVDAIAISNYAAQDITDLRAHTDAMWQPQTKKWRWAFMGLNGTIGTGATLAGAANDRAVVIGICEGSPSLPGEIATALACALLSRERPNTNYDSMELPIAPPTASLAFTDTEVETALVAGLTPLSPVLNSNDRSIVDGVVRIEKMVTTKTTENSLPYEPLREIVVARTGAYMARQVDIAYVSRFGPSANPEGVLLDEDTIDRVRDMIATLYDDAEDISILKNIAEDLALLAVEESAVVGRCDCDLSYTPVMPFHQLAAVHRVKVGAGN